MNQRILLIGKGHLGSHLKQRWGVPDELHWTSEMSDLSSFRLGSLAPDVVVNTAGKTDLTWSENNPSECFRCNVSAPISVYRAIKNSGLGCAYVHLSSGCVWDGPYRQDGEPFGPYDPPTPACFYAWTKAACDALLMAEESRAHPLLILRPRQVYSPAVSPRNTLSKLNGYPKLLDTPNSMTSANTIASTIEAAIKPHSAAWGRIMNVYEKGTSSPFEVGSLLADAGLRARPEKMTKDALDVWHKPKRVDAVIKDEFFEALVRPATVQDELKRNIALYAKSKN